MSDLAAEWKKKIIPLTVATGVIMAAAASAAVGYFTENQTQDTGKIICGHDQKARQAFPSAQVVSCTPRP